jgi:hypothetical protein
MRLRGAPGEKIHGVIVALWKCDKFRSMRSWTFVPRVLAQWFPAA